MYHNNCGTGLTSASMALKPTATTATPGGMGTFVFTRPRLHSPTSTFYPKSRRTRRRHIRLSGSTFAPIRPSGFLAAAKSIVYTQAYTVAVILRPACSGEECGMGDT